MLSQTSNILILSLVEIIGDFAFLNLKDLREIWLNNNKLIRINQSIFDDLKLDTLNLSNNKLNNFTNLALAFNFSGNFFSSKSFSLIGVHDSSVDRGVKIGVMPFCSTFNRQEGISFLSCCNYC